MSDEAAPQIDLNPNDWAEVSRILKAHVPEYDVWAFGSRAKWTAKAYSDLDLAVIADRPLGIETLAGLKSDFEESSLPIKVDVVDWSAISDSFRKIIESHKVVVSRATTGRKKWEVKRLIDCTRDGNLSYGVVQPGAHDENGVPLIRVNNFKDGHLQLDDVMRVSPAVEAQYKRTRLEGGEVLLTLVGSTGQTAIAPKALAGWNIARAVAVIRPKPEIGAEWINICLQSKSVQQFLDERANTTVQKTLNLSDVKQIPILLPPTEIKQAIESIATAIASKIELNRRMNATLEAMARALFQSWFVNFDPVRAKLDGRQPTGLDPATAALFPATFQDSPLGPIPHGWTVGKIKDCCTHIQNGGTPRRNESRFWNDGDIPWLTSGEVRQPIVTTPQNFITEAGLAESSAKWIPPLSTVIALYGATAGQVSLVSSRLTTNQAVCGLVPKKHFAFFNYLWMRAATGELENKAVGSAQQNISKGIVEETQVVLAPLPLVEKFADSVGLLFDHWISNLHQSRTLAALRDALLPKLLSGELSVRGETAEAVV